ncbi:MAG: ATP-binding protein [Chloroflexota bacterium]
MIDLVAQLEDWMNDDEDEHLEFKEAKSNFHFETLADYCAALANERGGKIILGVTDRRPRRVVGSQAFSELGRTKAGLIERLHLRIEAWEAPHPDGRVVVFDVPSRPIGVPISYKAAYRMRAGESLVDMTSDMLRRIFEESGPDFSQEVCAQATLADLAPDAIRRLREMWHRRSGNDRLLTVSDEQLLIDAELIDEGRITYAALILLGTHRALGRHLGQAEVVFEYRSSDASLPAGDRQEYREGFLGYLDDLWERINLRNDRQPFQLGLVRYEIQTFNERAVREVLLNAVSHRDYRRPESVFVRQYPRRLEVVSPGSFLNGISPDNVLWRQAPRNRRIAEVLQRCGLVERAGQGMNRIFEEQIKESKPRPDFSGTDDFQVSVTLHGEIQDERFLRLEDLSQVLPALTRHQVQWLLRTMKAEGRIHSRGQTRNSRWYPGPEEIA